MYNILAVAAGGSIGAVLRYLVSTSVQRLSGDVFPLGTLVVNVTGCLLIGVLFTALKGRWLIPEEYQLALLVGFLGAYTTFSAFGLDNMHLAADQQFGRMALYVISSNALGIAAVWFGIRIANKFVGV